jgi:hypothetical protein
MKKASLLKRENLIPEALFLLTALVVSFFFCQLRLRLCQTFAGSQMFGEIANQAGTKPWQYRILIPTIASALTYLNPPLHVSLWGWARLIEFVSSVLSVFAFRQYLELFLKDRRVTSILAFFIFLILPFQLFFPRPYHANYWFDTPSILFLTLGLTFMYRRKWALYYLLFFVATLNRETTCFLTVIYLCTALGREKITGVAGHCAAQFVIWMAIKTVLGRIYMHNPGPNGFEWYDGFGLPHYLDNLKFLSHPKNYPGFLSIMGFIWIPVLCYYRRIENEFVRRALWVIPPYFVGMFLVANIYELRIFTDLLPVVLTPFLLILADLLRNPPAEIRDPA